MSTGSELLFTLIVVVELTATFARTKCPTNIRIHVIDQRRSDRFPLCVLRLRGRGEQAAQQ